MSGAVVFLTVAIQIVIFNAAHYTPDIINSYLIATFYLGVAAGAFFCNKYKLILSWSNKNYFAYIHSNISEKIGIKLSSLILLSFFSVAVSIQLILVTNESFWDLSSYIIGFFVFISAFIFEILSVAIIDRIGLEEKKLNTSGMIMRTYGLMGIGAAFGFWLLGFMGNLLESSIFTLLICFILFKLHIFKRNENIMEKEKQVSLIH